jgi:hypothetical protein
LVARATSKPQRRYPQSPIRTRHNIATLRDVLSHLSNSARERPLPGKLGSHGDRLLLAELGHRRDVTEGPLISVLQSSTREGLLRIVEPPFLAADHSAANDLCGLSRSD